VAFDEDDGGPEQARRLVEGWKNDDWPGLLDPYNERLLRWARLHESAGPEGADALYAFEVDEGNEQVLADRVIRAIAYLRSQERVRSRKRRVTP